MEFGWDSFGSGRPNDGEGWVDLRLGETSNMAEKYGGETVQKEKEGRVGSASVVAAAASTSASASAATASKRTRVYYKAQQIVKCSVDECNYDLRNSRDYHRRHRVCEMHSKTAVVTVKGKRQRFCQQCSRFHSLEEFDDFKRSCRRRLDGHNKRRRKPHPPPLCFASDYRGPRLLQIGTHAADTYGNPYLTMWPVTSKTGAEHTTYNRFTPILPKIDQQSLLGPFANIQPRQEKQLQLPVLQHPIPNANELAVPAGLGMSMCETSISGMSTVPAAAATTTTTTVSENSCQKMSSDCALYLLSALQPQSSEFSMVESSIRCPIPLQPSLGPVQFSSADKCLCPPPAGTAMDEVANPVLSLDANVNTTANLHCNGMPRMGPDGFMENGGSSLTFPFFWE